MGLITEGVINPAAEKSIICNSPKLIDELIWLVIAIIIKSGFC